MKLKKINVFIVATFLVALFPQTLFTSARQPGLSQVVKKLRERVLLAGKGYVDGKKEVSRLDIDTKEFSFYLSVEDATQQFELLARFRTQVAANFFVVNFTDALSDGCISRGEVVGGVWQECCDLNDTPYLPDLNPYEESIRRRWQDEYEKFLLCCLKELDQEGNGPILADSLLLRR